MDVRILGYNLDNLLYYLLKINQNNISHSSVYENLQATRAKVAPVNFIYGSHFSATEATYEVSQNIENFCRNTIFTRCRLK